MSVFQSAEGIAGAVYVGASELIWVVGPGAEMLSCSKWFLQALGHEGLNNLLRAYEDKSAQAVCTFAYCEGPGHEPVIFEGRVTVSRSRRILCL